MQFKAFLGETPQKLFSDITLETGLGKTRKLNYGRFQITT